MPRQGPERIPVLTREHPDRKKQLEDAADRAGLKLSAYLRRAHAYALQNMPTDWVDPKPPSDQHDG